jgi:urease accessory protein
VTRLGGAPTLGRIGRDGALTVHVERRGAASVVARARWTLPLQVLAPLALDDPAVVLSLLNPTGGLVGGDRLEVAIDVAAGAHACVTTPSATKVYRTAGAVAEQTVRMRVAPGAALEWVPAHTIPSAGSALRQAIEATVDEDGRVILIDAFAAGRVAREEAWRFAYLDGALSVRDERGWLFHDRFVLHDGPAAGGLGGGEGCPYFATIVAVGARDPAALVAAVAAVDAVGGARAAAAPLPRRGVVARVLAPTAPALIACVDAVWAAARRVVLGLGPLALRTS